jgi:hypothetical protein
MLSLKIATAGIEPVSQRDAGETPAKGEPLEEPTKLSKLSVPSVTKDVTPRT